MLHIHFGNRIERLADALAAELAAAPPAVPLEPETIVIGHAGMDEWLKRALAERLGIAANLEFQQPASFVWRMLRALKGELPSKSPLDRGPLVWRLYAVLGEPGLAPELRNYLNGGDELKRIELAGEIAKVFEQYQMYRPEWLRDWQGGKTPGDSSERATAKWQAALWRAVAGGQTPNPARLYLDFMKRARDLPQAGLPARVSVFGIAAMAPVHITLLAAASLTREVHLYVPNPSRVYWGDIDSEKRLTRWKLTDPDRAEYAISGHPLLAALGTQSRDFIELLNGLEQEHMDEEHFTEPEGNSLLARLQRDVLNLNEPRPAHPVADDDESVLVHVCHSRRREVEVLHDALLAAFEADPGLGPEDILVMAPNMDDYAGHVRAVFGAAPESRYIPWSLAERSARAEHPLVEAFLTLLDLPASRLRASEVLGLLDLPAVARHYALDEAGLEAVHRWIREAGIRWGWDGEHRETVGVPPEAAFTWHFGLDRLLAGYALAPAEDEPWQGIAPWGAIEGQSARALGPLCDFAGALNRWRAELDAARTLFEWVAVLRTLLSLFSPDDPDEIAAVGLLRAALDELAEQARLAGFGDAVPLRVVRAALAGRLTLPRHPRPFLSGQVTFCALAPLRSIPAKFLWLLGMSEADFPRRGRAPGFDLIAAHPKRGDRARRSEDRALFLDALLSARARFHASYIGRSERDNGELPASVVINLLLDTLERMDAERENIVLNHPLQPFSASYNPADRRRLSFAEEWLGRPPEDATPRAFAPMFSFADSAAPKPRTIELADLIAGLSNPARRYLDARDVARPRSAESVEDDEPFVLDGLSGWKVRDELLARRLAGGNGAELAAEREALAARGMLPPGEVGRLAFERCLAEADSVARAVQACVRGVQAGQREVALTLGPWRLVGRIGGFYPTVGLVRARAGRLRARDRLALWIEELALLATGDHSGIVPKGIASRFIGIHNGNLETLRLGPVDDAAEKLQDLCALYARCEQSVLPFLPELSLSIRMPAGSGNSRQVPGKEAALSIAQGKWRAWESGDDNARISDAEDYAFVVRDREEPVDKDFVRLAMRVFDPLVAAEVKSCPTT